MQAIVRLQRLFRNKAVYNCLQFVYIPAAPP